MTEVVQLFREVATGSLIGVQQALAHNPALLTARDTRVQPPHISAGIISTLEFPSLPRPKSRLLSLTTLQHEHITTSQIAK